MVLPRSWLVGGLPYFAYCPSSSVPNWSSFGTSASGFSLSVFAMGSPFRVGSVSVLDRIEGSCFTFLVYASSLRDGVTLSGRGLFQTSIETKTCLAHLPLWLVSGLRDGVTHLVVWLFFVPSIGTKASSIHLSLVASRWGHPAGRVCGFPHSIVTKLSLVSCLVFLQDEVTLTGLDL